MNLEIISSTALQKKKQSIHTLIQSWRNLEDYQSKKEIDTMIAENKESNKNLKRLCRMARAWRHNCNVPMSGILIDTLAYKFLTNWQYKDKSYLYCDYMSRDFFEYLMNLNVNQKYWLAPGSKRHVIKNVDFQSKAATAYQNAMQAIKYENQKMYSTAKEKWRNIYGAKFPE